MTIVADGPSAGESASLSISGDRPDDGGRQESGSEAGVPSAGRPRDGRLIAGRFRLLEALGRGGMGRVYRARDELLGRLVAVKLIYDDSIVDSDLRHACALEARAAARLSHPGIVRILDSGFDDGHLYVVMSLAEGRTLSEVVRVDGPLPTVRALDIAMQVADALESAHQEGIIHCDVKPSNLIVRPDGTVQLVDFGIARIAASTTSLDSSTLQGSAEYVAPEQVEGSAVDGRTDLYALGVVLYEMVAGRTPFGGGTIASVLARRLVNDPPSLREANPQIPPVVDRLVRRMLARDPADRFQTAAQLHDALVAARRVALAASLPPPPAATFTATMPFPQARARAMRDRLGRARAGASKQGARLTSASERAVMLVAAAALAMLRYGRAASLRLQRASLGVLGRGHRAVPGLSRSAGSWMGARRSSLVSGIGIAVVVGLLIGTAAARCNVVGAAAETALSPESASASTRTAAKPTVAVPTVAAQPALTEPTATAPTAAPTATLPPPTAEPTPAAAEPPVSAVEPPAEVAPDAAPPAAASVERAAAPAPAVPVIVPLAAPSASSGEPAREPSAPADDPKPANNRQPDPPKKPDAPPPAAKPESKPEAKPDPKPDPKPAAKPANNSGPPARGNNGNGNGNGNGPQKKR